jgi:hypothetical protein
MWSPAQHIRKPLVRIYSHKCVFLFTAFSTRQSWSSRAMHCDNQTSSSGRISPRNGCAPSKSKQKVTEEGRNSMARCLGTASGVIRMTSAALSLDAPPSSGSPHLPLDGFGPRRGTALLRRTQAIGNRDKCQGPTQLSFPEASDGPVARRGADEALYI